MREGERVRERMYVQDRKNGVEIQRRGRVSELGCVYEKGYVCMYVCQKVRK